MSQSKTSPPKPTEIPDIETLGELRKALAHLPDETRAVCPMGELLKIEIHTDGAMTAPPLQTVYFC